MTIIILFWSLTLAVCTFAALAGGWEGRWFAICYLGQAGLLVVLRLMLNPAWNATHWPTFSVDMLLLLALLVIAIRTNRFWPLWVFGFHLITISAHLASLFTHIVPARAYFVLATMWAVPKLLIVVAGIWTDRRAGMAVSQLARRIHYDTGST